MKDPPTTITIVHELPRRWRLQLSVGPDSPDVLMRQVRAHEGVHTISYTAITQSLVISFDPEQVSRQEIMMRIAVALSKQRNLAPVYVLTEPARRQISSEVWTSGIVLLMSFALKLAPSGRKSNAAGWLGGLATSAGILEHARQEQGQKGHVDPEVWTLVYLLWSMMRGRTLGAAGISWFTVFGRHLLRYAQGVIEIRPVQAKGQEDVSFTVSLKSGIESSERLSIAGPLLESAVALMGGQASRFISELKHVTRLHDQVLHGLGEFDAGLPVKFS